MKMRIGVWSPNGDEREQVHMQAYLTEILAERAISAHVLEPFMQARPETPLYEQTCDAVLVPLSAMPTVQADHACLTAVLPRKKSTVGLLVEPGSADTQLEFRVPKDSQIATRQLIYGAQLAVYRPDVLTEVVKTNTELMQFASCLHDYAALARAESQTEIMDLDPSDITPIAGTGAYALLTLTSDAPTRRNLKPLHHLPTSQCTNIERSFERAFVEGDDIFHALGRRKPTAAHVVRLPSGHYRGHFCFMKSDGSLYKTMLTQNTFMGMDAAAIQWMRLHFY